MFPFGTSLGIYNLNLINHKGWGCNVTPLIYCKHSWLSPTLFTIWNQLVSTVWSRGKHSSQLKAEKTVLGHGKSRAFLLAHRGNSSSSLTGMAGSYLNTHPQLLHWVNQKKGASELRRAHISPSNRRSGVTVRDQVLSCTSKTLAFLHAPPLLPGLLRGTPEEP